MPHKRSGRRRERIRTSSQSSVEIQVTEATHTLAITTTTSGPTRSASYGAVPPSAQPLLFRPTSAFGELLKTIKAQGCPTHQGELFTLKQLCYYLKEYIKTQQLYDPDDPRVVYCQKDPLGNVFGVQKFTIHEALSLVTKNTIPVDLCHPRHSSPQIQTATTTQPLHFEAHLCQRQSPRQRPPHLPATSPGESYLGSGSQGSKFQHVSSPARLLLDSSNVSLSPNPSVTPPKNTGPPSSWSVEVSDSEAKAPNAPGTSSAATALFGGDENENMVQAGPSGLGLQGGEGPGSTNTKDNRKGKRWRRKRRSEKQSSECSTDSSQPIRESFSITYSSDGEGAAYTIGLELREELRDSDEESILSIQSKETVLVKDSSDDFWFLDDEEEDEEGDEFQENDDQEDISDNQDQGFSFRMDREGAVSFEIRGGGGGGENSSFMEEYEVESLSSHQDSEEDDVGSESPIEEIRVTISEDLSDFGFWADSESSDAEPESSDQELSDADKWKCVACQATNRPYTRHCDRCWKLRSDWLPDATARTESEAVRPCKATKDPNSLSALQRVSTLDLKQAQPFNVESKHSAEASRMDPNLVKSIEEDKINCAKLSHGPLQQGIGSTALGRQVTMTSMLQGVTTETLMDISPTKHCASTVTSTSSLRPANLAKRALSTEDSGLGTSFAYSSSQGSVVSPSDPIPTGGDSSVFSSTPSLAAEKMDIMSSPVPGTSKSPTKLLNMHQLNGKRRFTPPRPLYHHPGFISTSSPSRSFLAQSPCSPRKRRRVSLTENMDLCMICMSKPKEASIIHGKTGHQVCCYVCAKQLRSRGKPCPVCRRPIQKVIKNFLV